MLAARELIVVNILSAQGSFTNTVWQSLHMAYLPKQESKQLKLVLLYTWHFTLLSFELMGRKT